MAQPNVSVIIPTRDRRQELIVCLNALQRQTFPASYYEILICDDGSEEDLSDVVKRFAPALNVIHLKQSPKGPAAARNLGIRNAQASIIAMTDSDTVPHPDWLRQLITVFSQNPQIMGVEGKVMPEKPDELGMLGEGPTNLTGGVYLTCNCAYRREALLLVGGFDESFPYPAYEDVELAARVRSLGEIAWQPGAIVYHPRRLVTTLTVLKKLKHWEYVLIMGYRYGYLGWPRYRVSFPASRVILLSVIVLPLAKIKEAFKLCLTQPATAIELCRLGVLESLGAFFQVVPSILFGLYKKKIERRFYLFE